MSEPASHPAIEAAADTDEGDLFLRACISRLAHYGSFTSEEVSEDLRAAGHEIPKERRNVIGAVLNGMLKRGMAVAGAREPMKHPDAHGRRAARYFEPPRKTQEPPAPHPLPWPSQDPPASSPTAPPSAPGTKEPSSSPSPC